MVMIADVKRSCFNIQLLSERDHDLIKRYALAWAMRDLGFIRSTQGDYAGVQGTVTLNGDRLIDESTTMFDKLEEEIMNLGFTGSFVTG